LSFYTDVILQDARYHSLEKVEDVSLLEPETRAAVVAITADAALLGIRLVVTETYRSRERQQHLFEQGATRLQNVGVHTYGLAADFAKIIGGQISWAGDWSFLRDLAEKHGLISGLDWGNPQIRHTFVDPDHVQRCTLLDEGKLLADIWYPDSEYSAVGTVIQV
jgi:hypothetical protein